MVRITASSAMHDKKRSREFTKVLSDMTDQLRLLDQKITMAVDKEIQDAFHERKQQLNSIKYTINKCRRNQQTKQTAILHHHAAWRQSKKKLS